MPNLFISYRRIDSDDEAGRLAENLEQVYGQRPVFRDVDSIIPGELFDEKIDQSIKAADVVLVLIGPLWLAELKRRQNLPDPDYVRLEVAGALRRRKPVIPILVNGVQMPKEAELPTDLAGLTRRNALELEKKHWKAGVNMLLDAVGRPLNPRAIAARGLATVVLAVLFSWQGLPALIATAGIAEARISILGIMAIWLTAEGWQWYRLWRTRRRLIPRASTG